MGTRTDIHQFQVTLGKRLLQWGGLSTGLGAVLMNWRSPLRRGLGSQFAGWGVVNALIGWFGLRSGRDKAAQPEAHTLEIQSEGRRNLQRILTINTGLDVLYVAGGIWLSRTKGKEDRFWRGVGIGIVMQGGFLFIFDLIHGLLLRKEV